MWGVRLIVRPIWARRWFSTQPQAAVVAIVGRPNVGKSTLFNRIVSNQRNREINPSIEKAIVFNQSGTTREGKSAVCQFGRLWMEVSDTGGIEDDELTNASPLLGKMREKAMDIVKKADVVLVVIDAKEGVTPVDMNVGKLVLKNITNIQPQPRIVLVANKAEGQSMMGEYIGDCYEMDLGDPVLISAKANEGIDDLYERIVVEVEDIVSDRQGIDSAAVIAGDDGGSDSESEWYQADDAPPTEELSRNEIRKILKSEDPEDAEMKAAILDGRQKALLSKTLQIGLIGRPNSGKSSLLNALVREDRAIVDDHPGTTTDAIAVNWNFHRHQLRIVDTAGIMRGWKHATGGSDFKDPGVETMRTVNSSQVCVLVIDAFEAFKSNTLKFPSRQEVKLGNEVIENGKALVVAVNKWDLIPERQQAQFRRGLIKCVEQAFHDLRGMPIVFISTQTGLNLNTLLVHCVSVYRKWNMKTNSSKLNAWLEAFVARNPPPWKDGQKQMPKFITQTRVRPPTFSLYTNTFASFPDNYLRQMKELLKEEFGLRGIPMRINLRSTLMPKPGKRLRDRDVSRWKRLGPKQAAAVDRIRSAKSFRRHTGGGGRHTEDELD